MASQRQNVERRQLVLFENFPYTSNKHFQHLFREKKNIQRVPISQIYKIIKSLNFMKMVCVGGVEGKRSELENWTICATTSRKQAESFYCFIVNIYMHHVSDIFQEKYRKKYFFKEIFLVRKVQIKQI